MMGSDFRQSPEYQKLLKNFHTKIEELGDGSVRYVQRLLVFPLFKFLLIQGVKDPKALSGAYHVVKKYRCIFSKIAPRITKESSEAANWEHALNEHGYQWDKSAVVPTKTVLVNLEMTEAELLTQMKSKTRYNIRLAERRGVTTEVVDGTSILQTSSYANKFYDIYKQNCRRLKMGTPKRSVLDKIIEAFGDKLFIVCGYLKDGEVGAVALYIVANDTVSYQMNGSTDAGRHDLATNLVVWQGMCEGKRRGCQWFDFEGIDDGRYNVKKWEGFSRFKTGFGGEVVTLIGSYIKKWAFLKS